VRKYCTLAGVPVVCPHSLRGLHSTLAVSQGASARFVADALGHGSDAITKRHYIDPTQAHNASLKRVSDALMGKAKASATQAPDLGSLADTLRQLAPEQLQALLATVGEKR
jgi:integrase